MNCLLFDENELNDAGCAEIKDRRFDHLINVLHVKSGDELKAGVINGKMGRAVVETIHAHSVVLHFIEDYEPPEKLPLTILAALPRPKVARRLIKTCTEIGITSLSFFRTARVEKSYFQSPYISQREINRQIRLGLEQCCDTIPLKVSIYELFRPYVEDILPEHIQGHKKIVFHPYGDNRALTDINSPVTAAIGPEGGFVPFEIEYFQKLGFSLCSLGPRIITVEQTVPLVSGLFFNSMKLL